MTFSSWKNASPFKQRIMAIIVAFVCAIIITAAGTLTPIEEYEAKEIDEDLNQTVSSLKANGALLQYIFGNNFMFTLIMFVPIVGVIFGVYVFYNTGTVIAAIAISNQFPPALVLLALFLTPVAWLEFAAYSTALAENFWLIFQFWRRRGRHEAVNACKFISICAFILLAAAAVETLTI